MLTLLHIACWSRLAFAGCSGYFPVCGGDCGWSGKTRGVSCWLFAHAGMQYQWAACAAFAFAATLAAAAFAAFMAAAFAAAALATAAAFNAAATKIITR